MRRINAMAAAVAAASTMLASQVLAQGLEEVVVTAQKREQSLQDTPISIAAFDADTLEQKGVSNIDDLGTSVPNVKITRSPSNSTGATLAIRGSTTFNPAISWEATVGLYMDGIYIGKNLGGIFDVAELERVEVLRGPQGTLYGKNTLGGAVNLITAKPTGELGGKLKAGYGNYERMTGYGMLDLPALDLGQAGQIMARLSASYKTRDGLYKNKPDPFGNALANERSNREFNDLNSKVGRYDILWDVNDRLELRYVYDYSRINQKTPKQQLTFFDPSVPIDEYGTTIPADLAEEMKDYLTGENDNRRKSWSDQSGDEYSRSIAQSFFVTYDLGELGALGDVTLKYLANDRALTWRDRIDIDGSPIDLFTSARDITYDQQSHELQWIGATERIDYVLGLYYFNEEARVGNPITYGRDVYMHPQYAHYGDERDDPTQNNRYSFDNDSYAGYAQVEWRPGADLFQDRLTLTGGLRWTREKKRSWVDHPDEVVEADPSGTPILVGWEEKRSKNFTNTSPTAVAAWDFTDNVNGYIKLAYGWKAGGFNGEPTSREEFVNPYSAEKMRSVEVGMKSRWLDNRLQVNLAAFNNRSTDMQMSIFAADGGASSTVENAGRATIRGFEAELVALPTADLQFGVNYGYLDTHYGKFMEHGVDRRKEKDFPYAPRHSGSLWAEYTFLQSGWGELMGRVDYEYIDQHLPYVERFQNATSKINTYQLVNARLTLRDIPLGGPGDQRLSLALWGKNLLDKEYRINTIPFGAWTSSFYGDPRTYGIEATYSF